MTPQAFLRVLDDIAAESGTFDRATIGMPGMIRHGVVINTPHYITDAGPHTAVNRELAGRWRRFPCKKRWWSSGDGPFGCSTMPRCTGLPSSPEWATR